MNPHLGRLLALLNDRRARELGGSKPLERTRLVEALRLISAPYSLEAVAQYCQRFIQLVDAIPTITPPELGDIGEQLAILREVGAVGHDEPYFAQSHYSVDSPTPLQPYTGDGPLCDVLMLEAKDVDDQPKFAEITTWFVWLCLRYHHKNLSAALYARYLDGDGSPDDRLNKEGAGGPISAAGCQIRKLADPDQRTARDGLLDLGLGLSDEHGRYLSTLAQFVHRAPTIAASQIRLWARSAQLSEDEARVQLDRMRNAVPGALRLVLRLVWSQVEGREDGFRRRVRDAHRNYSRPGVHRYGRLREEIRIDDEDDEGAPVSIDVYAPETSAPPKPHLPSDAWADDGEDPDDPDVDSLYQLHVGSMDDDPIASYYAAKGKRYADEYENALLPWSRKRLGREALAALTVALHPHDGETIEVRAAKLIVLISFATGRTLRDARRARIDAGTGNATRRDAEIIVSLTERALFVLAATPELRRSQKQRKRNMTHAAGKYLAIELPPVAVELLGDAKWLGDRQLNLSHYAQAAKDWLAGLPVQFGIKPGPLRESLSFLLLEQTCGDLGLVKLITNRTGLNFTNIIHYSAYPTDVGSVHWAKAVTQLLRSEVRAKPAQAGPEGRILFVGTPDAMDKDGLRIEFERLRGRLQDCLGGKGSDDAVKLAIRAHNLLTLYTLLWLNLATAGRARSSPAPVAIVDGVALVSDKHRQDGSAERLVPLTPGVLAQLRAYFAYIWHLAFRMPELQPIVDAFSAGVIQFQFLKSDGQVVGYRPKWLYEVERLVPMPGNWARKLVRQELTGIGGRYLDAGMGHWVAGRHPYRVTSNFAFPRFREIWLLGQERLERELGFEVIAHPHATKMLVAWPVMPQLKPISRADPAKQAKADGAGPGAGFDFEAEGRSIDEDLFEGIDAVNPKDPNAAADLVLKMARLQKGSKAAIHGYIRACCDAARKKWKVPIFADAPRYQFQHDWLVNQEALYNLGYFTRHVLPGFNVDLEHLPAPSDRAFEAQVDLGRFVMLCIWRQGLVTWPVLDAFLQGYCANGILATGELRYVPSQVRCRRTGAAMHRVHYLEPYCQVYFVVEYKRLKAALDPLLELNPQQRRARIQSALDHYLRTLVQLDLGNILTITCSAAQQYHLVQGSPILAAYASAEFETHDLLDEEIRRLAGYEARSVPVSSFDTTGSLERTSREKVPLPDAEVASTQDIVHKIAYRRSPRVDQMCRDIEAVSTNSSLHRLLKAFAQWYLRREAKARGGKIKPAEKRRFQHVIEVVGYALVGLGGGGVAEPTIDEAFLVNLEEQFQDLHANLDVSEPFQVLRRFLRQRTGRTAVEKAGFAIGEVEPPAPRGVLAKIVTTSCIDAVAKSIGRVDESGIGNPAARTVAKRHLAFIGAFGLRRTEAEHAREMDAQGDLIRVQPYGSHTLKTVWSERVLPKAMMGIEDHAWMDGVEVSERQLLAHDVPQTVNGHNFFDAVNKLVQRKASDPDVHLHTVRHTLASRLLLSSLTESVDFNGITSQFPWLAEFLLPRKEMEVLFGGEGESGHGVQAIAAMLGHSHPLTTLRHYIHTVGIAFYAQLCGQAAPGLMRAFELRLGSSRTMQRRIKAWRAAIRGMAAADAEALVRQRMREEAEALCPDVVKKEELTSPDVSLASSSQRLAPGVPAFDPRAISYERFARVEEILREEAPNDMGLDSEKVVGALTMIYEIPTGKRGSSEKRHPCDDVNGRRLPQRLAAKSPTQAAAGLCDWLEQLRVESHELFTWLLDRWLHASEQEFGRIRLDVGDDVRWQQLPSTPAVTPLVERKVFKRKAGSNRTDRVQTWGRIRCGNAEDGFIRRDVLAVRWVMTWVSAMRASAD